jgi:catechol 2,3-dioxygenase-like lactoylglutathione lyase family enzyme
MAVRVSALDHIVINVADVQRSAEWYRNILGVEIAVFDPGPGKIGRR